MSLRNLEGRNVDLCTVPGWKYQCLTTLNGAPLVNLNGSHSSQSIINFYIRCSLTNRVSKYYSVEIYRIIDKIVLTPLIIYCNICEDILLSQVLFPPADVSREYGLTRPGLHVVWQIRFLLSMQLGCNIVMCGYSNIRLVDWKSGRQVVGIWS